MGLRNHRVLNNFVTELASIEPGTLPRPEGYEFSNPRDGWIFFRAIADIRRPCTAFICLDSPSAQNSILHLKLKNPYNIEAMRYLPKGRHTLYILCEHRAPISSIIVRTMPEILFANYPLNPHLKEYGKYDWEYLNCIGMLDSVNVIITGGPGNWVRTWTEQGRRVIQQTGVPGLREGEEVTADSAHRYWTETAGMQLEGFSGIIADEFYQKRETNFPAWVAAIKRIMKEKTDRVFYPYIGGPAGIRSFVEPLLDTCCRFAFERYLKEQPTEEEAELVLDRYLKHDLSEFKKWAPDFQKRLILVLGLLCAPPESLNTNPAVNYKVFMDMQFHLIATDPEFEGIHGIEEYLASYSDEEYLRWAAKLYRHYCIEGRTDRLSKDPYILDHIKNPDFENGLDGWSVSPAETGSIDVKKMEGIGWLQGRYPKDDQGDTFLWMKRSERKPNTVSQVIRNLQAGRIYSFKMYTGDFLKLTKKDRHAISVDIEGVNLIGERSFQTVFANCYSHHIPKYGEKDTYFNYFRMIFRATGETAKLTISDWISDQEPGGPVGQELLCNFIEIEPYLMEDGLCDAGA